MLNHEASITCSADYSDKKRQENESVAEDDAEFHFVFLLDPRMSDPGDSVQAQLWRASACTHGFREVSNACVHIRRMRIRLYEIFPCATFHVIYKSGCVVF